MRILISLFISFMLVFSFWTVACGNVETPKETKVEKKAAETKKPVKQTVLEANCGKCHKGDKDVRKINEAKGIKSTDDMIKLIRKGEKAKLHEKITDKNLKAAGNELFPVKKPEDVKKDAVKTGDDKKPEKPKKKPEGC